MAIKKTEINRCDPTGGRGTVFKNLSDSLFYFLQEYKMG